MLTVFEFVLTIIFMVLFFQLLNNWIKRKKSTPPGVSAELNGELQRLDELEERIQILEKIVTDANYDLKQQFRDLER